MRCAKTGVDVELMMAAEAPYQIWSGDVFECPGCGFRVVSGFGGKPVAEHFQTQRYATFAKSVFLRFWESLADKAA